MILDRLRSWLAGTATPHSPAIREAAGRGAEVLRALRTVRDPEMDVDIVSLGLVRAVEVVGDHVDVTMTLTTAGCPLGDHLVGEVERAIVDAGFAGATVDLEFEPPWTPEDLAPDIHLP